MGSASSVCGSHNTVIKIIPDLYCGHVSPDNEEIDVDALVLALMKLSCIFVDKKHLNRSFIDTVLSPKHKDFDAQFIAVALWIAEHHKVARATPYELFSLIKYVELYRPSGSEPFDYEAFSFERPRGKEIPAFKGQVRAREAKRLSAGHSTRFFTKR